MPRGPFYASGQYIGRVIRQSLGVSAGKGTPQFAVTFAIEWGLDSVSKERLNVDCHERTVYLYLTEKSKDMTLAALASLGFKGTSLKMLDPNQPGFHDLHDVEAELYCKHEEYEGEVREKWSINAPREREEMKPIDAQSLRKLDALFGKGLKDLSSNGAASKTGEKVTAAVDEIDKPGETDGDDIPF